ncbi:MAG: TonB-dependent receptor plug domain-containing protein [Opitutaceae bacterium]|nr:TonB-dependent receptor plug domain-containing protein [Opitutaceae bacterium]
MDVFTVVPDEDGYRAANTSAGTAFNAPIKDLPVQVQVVTKDFMTEMGAADIYQALEYVGGMQLAYNATASTTNPFNTDAPNVTIRGQEVGEIIKNGFKRTFPADTVSISRIDALSGPGGTLYGQGNMGGVISYSGPVPLPRPSYYLRQRFGKYDYYRTEYQMGGPLTRSGKLRYVMPAVYTRNKNIIDYKELERFDVNPIVVYQPFKNTLLKFEYEFQSNKEDRIDNGQITDRSAYGVSIDGRAEADEWDKLLQTPDFRTFRWGGPDTYFKRRAYQYSVMLTQKITDDLQLRLGWNFEEYHVKFRNMSVTFVQNGKNDGAVPMALRTDSRFLSLLRDDGAVLRYAQGDPVGDAANSRPAWMAELYYNLKIKKLVENKFILGATYQKYYQTQDRGKSRYIYRDNNFDWESNYRGAKDSTGAYMAPRLTDDQILSFFRSTTDYQSVKRWDDSIPSYQAPYWTKGTYFDTNLYANVVSSWFRGKVITTLGVLYVRNDRIGRAYRTAGNLNGPEGSVILPGDPDFNGINVNPYATYITGPKTGQFIPVGATDFEGTGSQAYIVYDPATGVSRNTGRLRKEWSASTTYINRAEPIKATNPSFNIAWNITDALNIYSNFSRAVNPGAVYTAMDGNMVPLEAPEYQNMELGFKWQGFARKIWLTGAVYKNKTKNGVIRGVPFAFTNNPSSTSGFSADLNNSFQVTGGEIAIDYRVNSSWLVNLKYLYNDGKITSMAPFVTPSRDPTDPIYQFQVTSPFQNADIYIGTNPNNVSRHIFRAFTRYEFKKGFMKGLWVNFGVKIDGPRETVTVRYTAPDLTNNIPPVVAAIRNKLQSRDSYDVNMGYRFKIGPYNADFLLNVVNLFDDQQWYDKGYLAPRQIYFSASVKF